MKRIGLILISVYYFIAGQAQQELIDRFISDSTMLHASASIIILDADSGNILAAHDAARSLSQASVMKLVCSAAALELLGPDHRFKTVVEYSGDVKNGILRGDIVIRGGGDPALGSERFPSYYTGFMDNWIEEIRKTGIRKIKGRIISDDTYFDFQPVPPNWNWEDIGNYYGAGAYGLSVFDNTIKLHFRTGREGEVPVLKSSEPANPGITYTNFLKSEGNSDRGYVYSSPYSNKGWISGYIPVMREDFILKASIPDPPLLLATLINEKLESAGIKVSGDPSTFRIQNRSMASGGRELTFTMSPPLSEIIEVLNHESVNLYAEHLLKEVGKVIASEGSTNAGRDIILAFLDSMEVGTPGMFIEDGSGLSPQDALSSAGLARLLFEMKKRGKYFEEYFNSLPEAGKEGTLKNYFRDPVFESAMRAKSGTILRVKSYAGYLKTKSGKELIFSIIVNNFTGTSAFLISRIEELLKELILYNE